MNTYKIGTRGSLLAVTQSTLVKNQLESLSGDRFELVLIKTQGDQITNKPLWQLEGKDFFTKELDEALLNDQVDLVIHSYKDLGSERPDGIKLAAITERRFAHDILLIRKDVLEKLEHWEGDFIVGTSSPRRIANLTAKLADYIPYSQKTGLKVKCEVLRGNVNTRIQKLKDQKYHAITLALAGIERLAHRDDSAAELRKLLDGLDYFVLPQSEFPSAASQGALGIEIKSNRQDEGKLLSIISQLAHAQTIEEVQRERKAFKEYGGGCHLAVGIHVKKIGENFLHVHAGEVDAKKVDRKWLEFGDRPQVTGKLFVGLSQAPEGIVVDRLVKKSPVVQKIDFTQKHVFVTTRYCMETLKQSGRPLSLWAGGTRTAQELTKAGYWVNGTSDSLGTSDLVAFKDSKALNMFHELSSNWTVLSHGEASSDLGPVVEAYKREEVSVSEDWVAELRQVEAFYWMSFPQYEIYIKKFPQLAQAHHFCGLGKTWQEFNRAGVPVHPVASMEDFLSIKKDQ